MKLLERFKPLELWFSNYIDDQISNRTAHIYYCRAEDTYYLSTTPWCRLPLIGWWFDVHLKLSERSINAIKDHLRNISSQTKEEREIRNAIISELDEEEINSMLFADGFDSAIIGIDRDNKRLVYSETLCIDCLMHQHNMTEEEAEEYFQFNVRGSSMGVGTPLFIEDHMIHR